MLLANCGWAFDFRFLARVLKSGLGGAPAVSTHLDTSLLALL